MTEQDAAEPTELSPRIGRTALRALALGGYTRYAQLTDVTPGQLLRIHGVGLKAIRILEEQLAAQNRSFASE